MDTLREALAKGKLDEFAKEHEAGAPGGEEAFNRALQSMAGKSSDASGASSPDSPAD